MRLLIDTHVLLWWANGDPRLSVTAAAALADPSNELLFSGVSAMEIATKVAIGKLSLPQPPSAIVGRAMSMLRANELPLTIRHGLAVSNLPLHHKDPFDRMLVAQAVVEGLVLLTQDAAVRAYAVPTLG
jgi:PIN domain nuclease of toxin-antitoxin system